MPTKKDKKEDKVLLTPQDKLHIMAKKNPNLELLLKEFNLQFI